MRPKSCDWTSVRLDPNWMLANKITGSVFRISAFRFEFGFAFFVTILFEQTVNVFNCLLHIYYCLTDCKKRRRWKCFILLFWNFMHEYDSINWANLESLTIAVTNRKCIAWIRYKLILVIRYLNILYVLTYLNFVKYPIQIFMNNNRKYWKKSKIKKICGVLIINTIIII